MSCLTLRMHCLEDLLFLKQGWDEGEETEVQTQGWHLYNPDNNEELLEILRPRPLT